mgnify:CR=1 FL=1
MNPERAASIVIGRCRWCGRLFQIKVRAAYCSSRCRRRWREAYGNDPTPQGVRIELDKDMNVIGVSRMGYAAGRCRLGNGSLPGSPPPNT